MQENTNLEQFLRTEGIREKTKSKSAESVLGTIYLHKRMLFARKSNKRCDSAPRNSIYPIQKYPTELLNNNNNMT